METITFNPQTVARNIGQMLMGNTYQIIKRAVATHDPYARIFLFGPGENRHGSPIDVYIASSIMDDTIKQKIKHELVNRQNLSEVGAVFLLKNDNDIRQMTSIGTEI